MKRVKPEHGPLSVLLVGLPGSGKGTQAAKLEAKGFVRLATGDLLREEIRRGSALGKQAERRLAAGHYMPDNVVQAMIEERARQAAQQGLSMAFDGFPRTPAQYEWLKMFLRRLGRRIDAAVELEVADAEILERLAGRIQCAQCGAAFHAKLKPPRRAGLCDVCGAPLAQRDDDKPEAVRERLAEFRRKTAPMLAALARDGKLVKVDGCGKAGAVAGRVTRKLSAAAQNPVGAAKGA